MQIGKMESQFDEKSGINSRLSSARRGKSVSGVGRL
jgi:hypothetical protein